MTAIEDDGNTRPRRTTEPELAAPPPPPGRAPLALWALLAMSCGLALALALQHRQNQRHAAEYDLAMRVLTEKGYGALQGRLHSAELTVRTVQTLFLTSEEVTDAEFEHAYQNLDLRQIFPSLLSVAYARREIRPDGVHFVTEKIAPLAGNRVVLGLDVLSQGPNLEALTASGESGAVILSAPFQVVQRDAQGRPIEGVIARLPVYSPGPAPRSAEERHQRLRGSVGIVFRGAHLVRNAFQAGSLRKLHVAVSDVTDGRPILLFDSAPERAWPAREWFDTELRYGGRIWRMRAVPLQPGPAPVPWSESMLLPGVLVSVLLGLLVWSLMNTRYHALQLGWRMSSRFRESEERFRALNEMLPALVLLADGAEGGITYANRAARQRLGESVVQSRLVELFADARLRESVADPASPGCGRAQTRLRDGLGGHFWANVAVVPVTIDGRRQLVLAAADVSEQRELTERLSYQATHDMLTRLYNRHEFERRLAHLLAADGPRQPGVLLYIDLDQFKLINDTSGHIAGDQLLAQLAVMMRQQLAGDAVLARLGGDEFGVLAPAGTPAAAAAIGERLRRAIDGYIFMWDERSYKTSASIGGVTIDDAGVTLSDLLAQADTACYRAKELGRNRVQFYSVDDDETSRRRSEMDWAARLRLAPHEGRLTLVYQEVRSLSPAGGGGPRVELLLRYRDEHGALVPPGAFMPAAERYGLMPAIDRWVIETALANFDRLHPSGAELHLAAINLSGASVEDDALAERIVELLALHRVPPGRVCFEITETVAVRNLSQAARFMERLREVGCQVALDDFGVGMSSFSYLKNLPVDTIKIDGSFIRDLLTDPISQTMVRAVTDIGHQLGLQVVAEWVTSAEIAQALVELGVDSAQGFALHHPELVVFQRDEATIG